jgi:type IV pilus assembly protein PilB
MLGTRKRLGDLLIEAGKLSEEQLKELLNKQKHSGKKLGELIIDEGILTENDIMEVLEIQLGIKRIHLDNVQIIKKAIISIPQSLAKKYTVIPIDFTGNKLRVAMTDPLNIYAMDDIKIASGFDVIPLLASRVEIEIAIDRYYSSRFVEQMAEQLTKNAMAKQKIKEIENLSLDEVKNELVVKLVDSIFSNAVKMRASDIHIEPFEEYIKFRYRVDGALQEVLRTPKESSAALVTRIKIMANLNIAEKRVPQDGRVITKVDGNEVDLRVSILPTVYGEKIVIRILKRDNFLISKDSLGMDDEDIEKLNRMIKSPYGIILSTGPTGSGKSTTLYTMLNDLNNDVRNIITVEDPVEYLIDGVNQVNVNTKAGLTFALGLRSILRQDPDVVMIGEIRDNETAEIAVRSAITGHLVLSTIHTNDSASAVVRLTDMGIEPYLIATSISGIIAQRLVRNICPNCRQAYQATEYEKKILGIDSSETLILYKGKGCPNCNNTGYSGRTGVFEIMEITKEHRELIQNEASTEEIKRLNAKCGIKTLRKSCINLILKGETTIEELMRIAFFKE